MLVVAHKVVSKAEGRIVRWPRAPGPAAAALAAETGKRAALCELILSESRRVVRRRGGTVICETHHGFVCANAGVDSSNAPQGRWCCCRSTPTPGAPPPGAGRRGGGGGWGWW